jgi:predicted Zn-dependent peptidase
MLHRRIRAFGVVHNLFGLLSPSSAGLVVGKYPPARPLPNHIPIEAEEQPAQVQVTTLPNGIRILTESPLFPSPVTLSICVGTGPRDEDRNHSGLTFALQNTYLKTNTRTNEQLNYCMQQMAGTRFSMEYDQEAMMYQGSCLAHDIYDFLQMMADMVLDDKTVIDEEAAHWRADEYFKLRELNKTHKNWIEDNWLTAAYGPTGLGMPLSGFHSQFQSIGYSHLNHFRKQNATPDRIIILAAGINNHDEFVQAVSPYFKHISPAPAHRSPAKYIGSELRSVSEEEITTVHMSFHGPPAGAESIFPLIVLRHLVGNATLKSPPSATRAYTHFMQKYPFLHSLKYTYSGFTDSSNWGLNVTGPSSQATHIANALSTELNDLTNVTDLEVERAKKRFQAWVCSNFTSAEYRLYKYAMGMRFEGEPRTLPYILEMSGKVTTAQVREMAGKLLGRELTMIVQGGGTLQVPSRETIQSRFSRGNKQ